MKEENKEKIDIIVVYNDPISINDAELSRKLHDEKMVGIIPNNIYGTIDELSVNRSYIISRPEPCVEYKINGNPVKKRSTNLQPKKKKRKK